MDTLARVFGLVGVAALAFTSWIALSCALSWWRACGWPRFRAGCGPHLGVCGRLQTAWRIERRRPSRGQNAGVDALPGVVASWSSRDALGVVDARETCKPCGPPPSLGSATAVLAAARGTGARSDAATHGGRSTERFAERGARSVPPGEESAASGLPRGGVGSPRSLMAR